MDWDRDASQWPPVLAAARNASHREEVIANPLWPIYAPLARVTNGALVIGQIGQSLDGRIATVTGHSHFINGPAALAHLHRLRALVDAVVIGVGTAITDDPQMTVRHVRGPQPARVIIDPAGRLPDKAKCLRDDGVRRIVVQARKVARPKGVECIELPGAADGIAPKAIIAALAKLGLAYILVEGGAVTLSRFIAARCLNRLHVLVAPMIIGAGPTGFQLPPIARLDQALRPPVATHTFLGGDVLFDCSLDGKGL